MRIRGRRLSKFLRWGLAAGLAAGAGVLSLLDPLRTASWSLLGCLAAICLLLPVRLGLATYLGIVLLGGSLAAINRLKIDLTGLPLTMLDLRIAVNNPAGLWDALALPQWSRNVVVAALLLLALGWIFAVLSSGWRVLARRRREPPTLEPWARLAAVTALGVALWLGLERLYGVMGQDDSTWHPERVARLSHRTGILPFLAYSYHIESQTGGDIYRAVDDVPPLGPAEVSESALRYIEFPDTDVALPPNVAIVLAESTFDPSRAFRLRDEWHGWLFGENDLTVTAGPLRVNTLGGGTWVAEFETITGLDSRLFGYSGAYTHASLAPFVERSFAEYLGERGYATWAFLSNRGDFYNSRQAFESYGFEHVFDSEDLGSKTDWFETDTAVVESALPVLGPVPAVPLFLYLTLIENHGPHECAGDDAPDFRVTFADGGDFARNCALHEYLRRLDSTTAAVRTLLQYLVSLEQRTGHPFVLLVFGDHQPYTFTGGGDFDPGYADLRTTEDAYITFFHILSSADTRLECCTPALPIAALPTIVSAFVASGPEDLYLGENLWLYAQCGTDAVRADFADHLDTLENQVPAGRTAACAAAYPRALAAYRSAGIIRLE